MRSLFCLILLSTGILLGLSSANGQVLKKYPGYSQHYFKGLRYGLFKPANYDARKSYPLIVYLHGSRDTVSRDNMWYQPAMQSAHPCFVLSPKCDEPNLGWGSTWQAGHTPATAHTLALVDSLVKTYHLDVDRLYVYGISMGGFGVFSMLEKESGKFAAAYAICGGSDVKAASKLIGTPLWIFHGDADDVVPVRLSRDVYQEILQLGGKSVRYTEYPGVKHNSWENVAKEKTLDTWLFSHKRASDRAPSSKP